jgi:hypothetical protein
MQRIYAKMKYRYKRKILFNQSTEEEVAGYKKFLALRTPEAKLDEKHPSGPRASIEALRDQRAPAAGLDADHSATPGTGTPGPGAYSTVHSSIGSGPRFRFGTSVRWGNSDLILRNGLLSYRAGTTPGPGHYSSGYRLATGKADIGSGPRFIFDASPRFPQSLTLRNFTHFTHSTVPGPGGYSPGYRLATGKADIGSGPRFSFGKSGESAGKNNMGRAHQGARPPWLALISQGGGSTGTDPYYLPSQINGYWSNRIQEEELIFALRAAGVGDVRKSGSGLWRYGDTQGTGPGPAAYYPGVYPGRISGGSLDRASKAG